MPERTDRHGWIDLLVPDGPFLSAAALDVQTVGENWPTRLSAEQRRLLTAPPASEAEQGEGWDDSSWDGRRARVTELLTELLGYQEGKTLAVAPGVAAHHHIYRARVSADFAIHPPGDPDDVRMVVICGPDATDEASRLDPARTHTHDGWVSTPVQRAALLARHADADLALVTNGHEHLLVNVVTGTTGSAMWTINGLEDRQARDAFVALLHKQRVLHRTVPLSKLIELSQDRQHELTDTLGKQVRRAAEALVNAISRANRTSRGRLLEGLTGQQVYAATTRVLMRTVFLLVAEERGLLPVAENQLFSDQYAMSTLLDKLEEDAYRNRSAMERRAGAWQRMMALSRAVHAGIEHDDLRLPAYGGDLFDPDEHPFLEARITAADGEGFQQFDIGVVDDFTVLTVLRHLQIANGQRISFRSLDVEQIGHVYEALLDHSAVIVEEDHVAVLGLIGKAGDEPEISLVQLEGWDAESEQELGKQLASLGVAAEAKGVYNAMEIGLAADSDVAHTLNVAVANDETLRERVEPYAPLLRTDARGVALVFLPGDVYVTETSDRSDSGSYYTPSGLVSEILDEVLEPSVAEALEGLAASEQEEALLHFTVCDPACGSGAFLVGAARRLAAHLHAIRDRAPSHLGPTGREIRDVISRCIYGADIDPMAIQLAKLSLWIEACGRDEPLSFLDHHFVVGDSLVGARVGEINDGIPDDAFSPTKVDDRRIIKSWLRTNRERRSGQESLFADEHAVDLSDVRQVIRFANECPDNTIEFLADKKRRLAAAHATPELQRARAMADAWCSAFTSPAADGSASPVDVYYSMRDSASAVLASAERNFVHWELAFPELKPSDGQLFDVVIGNPPYLRGREHSQTDPKGRAFSAFRWEACSGSNWNLYIPFILLAARLARRRSGLLVQSSVLGAQYSDQLHAELLEHHGLQACLDFSAVPSLFHGATVRVACLVVVPFRVQETAFVRYGDGLRVARRVCVSPSDLEKLPSGCWSLPTSGLEEDEIKLFLEPPIRLGDVADISDGMAQGAAYDVRPLVHEAEGRGDELRLTTTGLIDPFVNHWGAKPVRYLKDKYERPVLDADALIEEGFPEMAEQGRSEKIGIAGLSSRIEAVVDEGVSVISKSAMVVRITDPDICPHAVAVVLNSDLMNAIYDGAFGSMVFGAGDKNYRPNSLGALPLPRVHYLARSVDEGTLSGLGRMIADTGKVDPEAIATLTRAALLDQEERTA